MSEMKNIKVPKKRNLKRAAVETARHQCGLYSCVVCCYSGNTLQINKAPMKIYAPIGPLKCKFFV